MSARCSRPSWGEVADVRLSLFQCLGSAPSPYVVVDALRNRRLLPNGAGWPNKFQARDEDLKVSWRLPDRGYRLLYIVHAAISLTDTRLGTSTAPHVSDNGEAGNIQKKSECHRAAKAEPLVRRCAHYYAPTPRIRR